MSINHVDLVELAQQLTTRFDQLLNAQQIAGSEIASDALLNTYLPIAAWLVERQQVTPHFVGINGAQGSGKSTLCKILELLLSEGFGKRVATISIDDLYLTRTERCALADTIHPLLVTRGVPGTHDVAMGKALFQQFKQAPGTVRLPLFDKSIDDRAPQANWPTIELPVDIVLFEGWCVGSQAQPDEALINPINVLEEQEDSDGRWRGYVNQQLADHYPAIFEQLNSLIMLQIPNFEKAIEWRTLQEKKLREQKTGNTNRIMDAKQLARFMMHYERLTRANLAEMPSRADLLLKLNQNHQIDEILIKEPV